MYTLRLWASDALACCYKVVPVLSLSPKYVSLFRSPLQNTEENSYIIHPTAESEHLFNGRLNWVLKDYTVTLSNYKELITQFLRYYSQVTPQEAKPLIILWKSPAQEIQHNIWKPEKKTGRSFVENYSFAMHAESHDYYIVQHRT